MGDLTGLPALGSLSATALLGLWVLLVMLGKMPTPGQLRDAQADRDHWRASADRWQQVATQHGMTLERLVVLAETSNHALTEIQSLGQQAADRGPG